MRGPLHWLSQVVSVTAFSLRSIPQRIGWSASAAVGIAGVVAVMIGVLSIAQGFRQTLSVSAEPESVIVLRSGADTEMMSGLGGQSVEIVAQAPGLASTPDGPAASPELFVIIDLPKRSTGTDANVPLRGVERPAFHVRETLRIVEGRPFRWGLNEVIVGVGAVSEFAGLELGSTIEVGDEYWPVVGVFEAGGGVAESEIWSDAAVLQPAYRRGNSYQAVYARLVSPGAFDEFKDALTTDPRLNVKVVRAAEYYEGQSTALYTLITVLGYLIAFFMAVGAVFGALNTMYTAVAARTREIATLRALGFRYGPVVVSVLIESVALAMVGGVAGAIAVYLALDGFRAATLNFASFSQVAFAFDVTPGLLAQGVVWAVLIGAVGGFFPAIRAARLPVATALREQ